MLKFKMSDQISQSQIESIVRKLETEGITALPLFPEQKRKPLRRIFCIDSGDKVDETKLKSLLQQYGTDIDYVEGQLERKLAG